MQKKWEIAECSPLPPLSLVRQPGLGKGGREEGRGTSCQKGMDTPPLPPSSWSWGHTVGRRRRRGSGGGRGRGVEWGSYARRRRCHRETRGGAEKIGAASEKAAKAAGERKDPSPRGRNLGGRRRRRLRLHFPKKKNPLLSPPPSIFFPSKSEGRKETSGCRRFGFGPKKGRGGHWSQ